jgi:hypothetical protein
MERKSCSACGQVKDVTEFNYRAKAKGLRQRYCRICTRLQLKTHYERHTAYYLRKARRRNHKIKRLNQEKLLGYLAEHPCVDCGEADVVCLEFDHVRGEKLKPISAMVGTYEWETIKREVEKCEVRCANCHRRKTARQGSYYKLIGFNRRP